MKASVSALSVAIALCLGGTLFSPSAATRDQATAQSLTVTLSASQTTVTKKYGPLCPEIQESNPLIELEAVVQNFTGRVTYKYSVTDEDGPVPEAKIIGRGRKVILDLSDRSLFEGPFTVTVLVRDSLRRVASHSVSISTEVHDCMPPRCPSITVDTPTENVRAGQLTMITARSQLAPRNAKYVWTLSAGTIIRGQGTSSIVVDTRGLGGQAVTAAVTMKRVAPACTPVASGTFAISN